MTKINESIKLSICMIVKNEEANLKRCLDSFLPIIHEKWCELIIVDTGSTDRTLEVAREYTDKVYEKQFIPWHFSKARNYGIAKAVGTRIMIVDADEELTQRSLYILEDAILNPKYADYKTIFIRLHNFYSVQSTEYAEVSQARIFRNTGKPLYEFSIHNKATTETPYLFLDNVIFNHYGYLFDKADLFIEKKERSLPMLEAEYEKNHEDLHILTHLIKTYYACNNFKKTVEHGERWMELMRDVEYHEGWSAYLEVFTNVLSSYVQMRDGKNAERVLRESKRYTDRLISCYLILGQYYLSIKKIARARELFEHAYMMYKQPSSSPYDALCSSNTAVIMPEIMNYLATLDFMDGNFERAGNLLNEGIRLNENRLPLRWDIFNEPSAAHLLKKRGKMKKRAA